MTKSSGYHIGLLLFRIGIAGMLLTHGIRKLEILFSSDIQFSDPLGLGPSLTLILVLFTEIICTVLIIIGYKTRLASIPLIILFLVIVFVVKSQQSFEAREIALLYLVSFVLIGLTGAGRYSIDRH